MEIEQYHVHIAGYDLQQRLCAGHWCMEQNEKHNWPNQLAPSRPEWTPSRTEGIHL